VSNPTAHVTKRKSRLKVYGGVNVYMNEGETFEIELHNPKTISILAKIKLNGNYISTTGLVIRPGQRVFLERFLDSNNKFVFHTYEVKDTRPNRDAIAFNGNVEVEFYDEQPIVTYPHLSGGNWGSGWTTINTGSPYYGNMTFTTASTPIMYSNTSSFSSSVSRNASKKGIETGRIEKGQSSDQDFVTVNENFSQYVSHKVVYKILPLGNKTTEIKEIVNYCPECGKKQKKEYKFCPSCGTKL
jgi:hypothetical protein